MSETRFKELVKGFKELEILTLHDFSAFTKSRAEGILAGTDMPLDKQAEIMKLHSILAAEMMPSGGSQAAGVLPLTMYPDEAINSFEGMNLRPETMKSLKNFGMESPSAIQQIGIKPIKEGKDCTLQAPVGTGKTTAACIGILERIDPRHSAVQALIVCPTHEEAEHADDLMSHCGEQLAEGNMCFSATFFGRTRMRWDDQKMNQGVVIGIGTPVRLLDLMRRGTLKTNDVRIICFDNADDLLYNFNREVYALARLVPRDAQHIMTSTYMPMEAVDFAHWFFKEPMRLLVKDTLVPEGVKQFIVAVQDANESRLGTLADILTKAQGAQTIVFCNTRWKVNWVSERLTQLQYKVSCVHSDILRQDRDQALDDFKRGYKTVLVTTEKLSAAVDPQTVAKIIVNFDLPFNDDSYVLRIGRVGRFGRKAIVINFENPGEIGTLSWFESRCNCRMERLQDNFMDYLK